MSITAQMLQKHLRDPAVFCCQRKKGHVIGADDLEDPSLFDDLAESGLIELGGEGLTIEQVVGRTLVVDCDALKSIQPQMLDGVNRASIDPERAGEVKSAQVQASGMIHLEIAKLEGLKLDIPMSMLAALPFVASQPIPAAQIAQESATDKVIRTLTKKTFAAKEVKLAKATSFANGLLTIDEGVVLRALLADPLVKELKLDIILPQNRKVFTQTIMDVCPVSTKVTGKLGEGVTHTLGGVVFMLTGVDEDGVQVHEFGSSDGYVDEKMAFGRPGCADMDDIIVRIHAVIQRGTGMERRGPFAAHSAQDVIIQEVRDILKTTNEPVAKEEICRDVRKQGRPRVVLIKEIMGQGAMHDNILCPLEPAGIRGGQKNVDLGNVPVMMTPNQVRDGAIHALTCIGPATKEMTRHYFREPLVEGLAEDDELDLVGVIFVGSPQVNDEKLYVSERLGTLVETLNVEGAIVTTEGFGNNHIDFASHIEQVGMRGIPVVGVSFCAYQGQLVVGNPYMDAMVELNKDKEGFENEIAGCSTLTKADADRAILMLKTKMAGIPIASAERKWNNEVIAKNQRIVDGVQTI